jgi:hypothetical protein
MIKVDIKIKGDKYLRMEKLIICQHRIQSSFHPLNHVWKIYLP